MGKRKHRDEEENISRKIRKLKKKRSKIRRERRHRSYSSNSYSTSDEHGSYSDNEETRQVSDPESSQEASNYKEVPIDDENTFVNLCNVPERSMRERSADARPRPTSAAPVAGGSTDAPTAPIPEATPPSDLDPSILCLLGDEPAKEEKFGPSIHNDIASRWSDVLVNGLQDELRKEIIKCYEVPENFKLVQAPLLNAEIKAAAYDNALKRDTVLLEKQKILTAAITSVATTISTFLQFDYKENEHKTQMLKSLSDTGRLLCHLHFSETQVRRNFLLACLSKEVKDNIKDLKRDHLLFGNELQENLKSMKAITKTGAKLRPAANTPKVPPKNKPTEASTSRSLNWRGPPPPQPPTQQRRNQAGRSSTAGGRRQPPPARRTSDRRGQRYNPRTSRR